MTAAPNVWKWCWWLTGAGMNYWNLNIYDMCRGHTAVRSFMDCRHFTGLSQKTPARGGNERDVMSPSTDTCAREWMMLLFGKHADRWHSRQRRSSVEHWWWWSAGPPGRRAVRLMDSLDMGCCQYMSRSVVHHPRAVWDMLQITAQLIKMRSWDTWSVGELIQLPEEFTLFSKWSQINSVTNPTVHYC